MPAPEGRRRTRDQHASRSAGRTRRSRGQWVAGSVVYGSVTLISDVRGDVEVSSGERPLYRIDSFGLDRPVLSIEQARERPSRLLQVRYELVDFVGRGPQLKRLRAWRDGPEAVSVLLVHGTGGQGKSRLALHFARYCADEGWQVLSGRHASDQAVTTTGSVNPEEPKSGENRATNAAAGILITVDYAERWPLPDLLALLVDATRQDTRRIRILLLARPAGTWWQTLSYRIDQFGFTNNSMALPPLTDQVERQGMFETACEQFASALDLPRIEEIEASARLDRADSGLVLTVHMAALAAVDACSRDLPPPTDPAEVSAYLLIRERDHWQRLHDQGRIRIDPTGMTHTVYSATLVGPLSYAQSLSAIEYVGVGSNEHPDRIVKDHALAYPPPHDQRSPADAALQPLYPDRLGEDFLALTTPGHSSSYEPDPWASEAPARLLAVACPGDPPSWTARALTTLIETARRWPHVATGQLYPLLKQHPRLALAATGAALITLTELPDLDMSVLEHIEAQLPEQRHNDLDTGIAAVTARLTAHRLSVTNDPAIHARLHAILGRRLSFAGQHKQALAATREAVAIYRLIGGGSYCQDLWIKIFRRLRVGRPRQVVRRVCR